MTFKQQQDQVLTIAKTATELNLSVATVRRLGHRGDIKILQLSPRRLGIRRSEIERFLRDGFDGK